MMNLRMLMFVYMVAGRYIIIVNGKVYERCELARELRDVHEIPDNQLATWVCIARHESEFNTSAINHESGDHGLLQISQIFWCSPPGYACGVSCEDLRNNDIEDDIICARRVWREHKRISGDGFNAWVVYEIYCRDKQYANSFLEGCFKRGELGTVIKEIDEKPLPTVDYYPHLKWKTTKYTAPTPTTSATETIKTIGTTEQNRITSTTSQTTQQTRTTQPTTTLTSVTTTKEIQKPVTTVTSKESTRTTTKSLKSTKLPAKINNKVKLLRPIEEHEQFTYIISKTGYKFSRF